MENKDYQLGSIVVMKKQHPCGTNEWEIVRVGADIKIKCLNCGRTVLIPRIEFNKKLKKIKFPNNIITAITIIINGCNFLYINFLLL